MANTVVRHVLACMLLAALCSALFAAPALARTAKKPKACKKGTVSLTVNKQRKCVKASTLKPLSSKFNPQTSWMRLALGLDGGGAPRVKLHKGKPFRGFFTKTEQAGVLGLFGSLDSDMLSRAEGVGLSAGSNSRATHTGRGGWKGGASSWSQSTNPETGQTTGSGHAEGEATMDDGGTVKVEMDVDATTDASGGADPSIDVGVNATYQSGSASTSSRGFKVGVTLKDGTPSCPTYTGSVEVKEPVRVSTSASDADHIGKLEVDSVKSTVSVNGMTKSSFVMQNDATLPMIPFTATITTKSTFQAKVLGVSVMNQKIVTKVTASGTIDPKTGNINTGTDMSVSATASGVGNAASARTVATTAAIKSMRQSLGAMHKKLKALEKNALNGQCTRIDFSPATDTTELGRDETLNLRADLRSDTEQDRSVAGPVKVTFAAQKGKVSQAAVTDNPANTTVTGGPDLAEPAILNVRAVSRAGVSETIWEAKMKNPFPKTYSGSVSYDRVITDPPGTTTTEVGAAAVVWSLGSWKRRPDGTYIGNYDLSTFTPTHLQKIRAIAGCTYTSVEQVGTVSFLNALDPYASKLQIIIDLDGNWTARSFIDVNTAVQYVDANMSNGCGPGVSSNTLYSSTFKYNDSAPGAGDAAFRPTPKRGVIEGTNVTDLGWYSLHAANTASGHATWHYTPSVN